ncbi:phage tail assembly chaperone [bacterium]|nr:phage tail assembly chaperone [bacterium]
MPEECFDIPLLNTAKDKREQKLKETDHWCLSDRTPTEAQLAYRQAIRDMPTETDNYPWVLDWPTKPE